ncbi:MAG: serine hydrolase domain-containing protein [Verrucomicrobiia bacterium]
MKPQLPFLPGLIIVTTFSLSATTDELPSNRLGDVFGAAQQSLAIQPVSAPTLSISRSGSILRFEASNLEVGKQSVVQRSTNLVDWFEIRSLKATTQTSSWTEARQPGGWFYRLIQDPGPQKLIAATVFQNMRNSSVYGLSIAVVTNGQIAWAQGFGLLARGKPEAVDTNTLFQAASISKPTTALATLRLVEQGQLSLSEPVNNKLKTLLIPGRNGTNVTIRHILSHTGGLTVSGFPGYPVGSKVPTLLQILKGQSPANTPAIVASGTLGAQVYSGGGYTFLQALLVDVSGQPFPDLLRTLVLEPLQMQRSTFEQPLPTELEKNAACAHVGGAVLNGRWHIYPEMAAAGLWTTPSDLARMFLAIRSAFLGSEGSIVREDTAAEMLTSRASGPLGPYGLGLGLHLTKGAPDSFWHTGGNVGYLSGAIAFVNSGDGVFIMTNSDTWICTSMYNACASFYGWPLDRL